MEDAYTPARTEAPSSLLACSSSCCSGQPETTGQTRGHGVDSGSQVQEKQLFHAHLVVVTSLLNELVHYFLCLLVTFLLQVSDERVQMAGAVIGLYDRLMGLDHTSDTWRHKATT